MLNSEAVMKTLADAGLGDHASTIEPAVNRQLADGAHGGLRDWQQALAQLPALERQAAVVRQGRVAAGELRIPNGQVEIVRESLLKLKPWRKGPFQIGQVTIDAEWQSDQKWARIESVISPLEGRRILDVGCGNGYYAIRMHLAGARVVIGVDPTLLYVMQYNAVSAFLAPMPIVILPLRLDDLPAQTRNFDTVFSMGVLYHQRAPIDHLRQLRDAMRSGGELLLETLVLPGTEAFSRTPPDRYARMRNVWHLPSIAELSIWISRAGFRHADVGAACTTTTDEQRSTEWMPFESLAEALDPEDDSRTIEGWPAPQRVIVRANAA